MGELKLASARQPCERDPPPVQPPWQISGQEARVLKWRTRELRSACAPPTGHRGKEQRSPAVWVLLTHVTQPTAGTITLAIRWASSSWQVPVNHAKKDPPPVQPPWQISGQDARDIKGPPKEFKGPPKVPPRTPQYPPRPLRGALGPHKSPRVLSRAL